MPDSTRGWGHTPTYSIAAIVFHACGPNRPLYQCETPTRPSPSWSSPVRKHTLARLRPPGKLKHAHGIKTVATTRQHNPTLAQGRVGGKTKSGSAHLAPSRAPRTQHAATARLAGWLTPQCKLTQRQLSLNAETSLLLLLRLFIYFT